MKTTTTKALVWAPIHATNTERTKVKAQLADDCKNGIAHFSLTCDIYEKNKRGQWEDVGGGCAHEHILKAFKDSPDLPHLAQLARLHLSDQNGVPMHGPENAFYWFAGMFADGLGEQYHGGSGRDGKSKEDCARIFAEHIRATPEQFAEIVKLCPHNKEEMSHALESLGFRAQWKAEANALIAWLESKQPEPVTFHNEATRQSWEPLTPEKIAEIESRKASGYYLPEQIEARRLAKVEGAKAKRRAEAHKTHAGTIANANRELSLALALIDCDAKGAENTLYYPSTGEIAANWADHRALWTRTDWDAFTAKASQIPELSGLSFKWNEKPRKY
jgi:hypothetical protein